MLNLAGTIFNAKKRFFFANDAKLVGLVIILASVFYNSISNLGKLGSKFYLINFTGKGTYICINKNYCLSTTKKID